jgi:hypothetical protein
VGERSGIFYTSSDRPSAKSVRPFSPPPTWLTRIGSSTGRPPLLNFKRTSGSTNPKTQTRKLTKLRPGVSQDTKTQTVYITRSGKRYHRDGCRYLAASRIPISLKDAKARGFTACKVCHPPE